MQKMAAQLFCVLLVCLTACSTAALPVKSYLPVPFLCQAPYGNWSEPWQDACEEASIIMAIHYIKGTPLTPSSGDKEILSLVNYEMENYGGHFDLTAEKTARLVKEYYGISPEVRFKFTVTDIKEELAKKNIVIAPMAGRMLGNPYYTPPGPAYHYMVFRGYDDRTGQFITNDSGTRHGLNYRYKYLTAYNAIHDWTGNKATIPRGKKVIIVFPKTSI
ncbi:MAG TPA: C39 family peptidase [Candidatus Omnitrophota bacterium]|nr:C39 family peptidase [Candidatus Omnitrophota bacterium]